MTTKVEMTFEELTSLIDKATGELNKTLQKMNEADSVFHNRIMKFMYEHNLDLEMIKMIRELNGLYTEVSGSAFDGIKASLDIFLDAALAKHNAAQDLKS
jgi:hypothetical protein